MATHPSCHVHNTAICIGRCRQATYFTVSVISVVNYMYIRMYMYVIYMIAHVCNTRLYYNFRAHTCTLYMYMKVQA